MSVLLKNNSGSRFEAETIGHGTIQVATGVHVRKGTIINMDGGSLIIGTGTVIGYYSIFVIGKGHMIIGSNSLLGPYNMFIAATHTPVKGHLLKTVPMITGNPYIGDNVWSGSHCTFDYDVNVNDDVIIGANSFVRNRTIDHNEVWGGVPAKFLKKGAY